MKGKKLLSVLLTLALVLSFVPVAFAANFADTKGHWAEAAIERWSGYGIVNGDERGFRPNDTMTRAEAATVFAKLFALSDGSATKTTYPDLTADKWYYEAMNKCINAGIMNGMDGMANGDGTMTREMFFVMFARALGLKEQDTTKGLPADGAAWSAKWINALTDRGFVQGMDGKVNATGQINRASVMTLLNQTISVYANEDGKTYTGTGKGVMLVTANECTVTGDIDMLVIASDISASGATAKVNEDGSVSAALLLAAGKANIKIEKANINTIVITESGVSVSFSDGTVQTIAIPEGAEEVEVEIAEGAEVGSIEVAAPNTSISNSGVVTSIEVAETATGAEVTAEAGSYTGVVVTKAAETTVSGSGAVANVVASGDAASGSDAVTVTTSGTKTAATDDSGKTTETTTSGALPAASSDNAAAATTAATEAATEAAAAVSANEAAASDSSSETTTPATPTPAPSSGGGGTTTQTPYSVGNAINGLLPFTGNTYEVKSGDTKLATVTRASTTATTYDVTFEDGTTLRQLSDALAATIAGKLTTLAANGHGAISVTGGTGNYTGSISSGATVTRGQVAAYIQALSTTGGTTIGSISTSVAVKGVLTGNLVVSITQDGATAQYTIRFAN